MSDGDSDATHCSDAEERRARLTGGTLRRSCRIASQPNRPNYASKRWDFLSRIRSVPAKNPRKPPGRAKSKKKAPTPAREPPSLFDLWSTMDADTMDDGKKETLLERMKEIKAELESFKLTALASISNQSCHSYWYSSVQQKLDRLREGVNSIANNSIRGDASALAKNAHRTPKKKQKTEKKKPPKRPSKKDAPESVISTQGILDTQKFQSCEPPIANSPEEPPVEQSLFNSQDSLIPANDTMMTFDFTQDTIAESPLPFGARSTLVPEPKVPTFDVANEKQKIIDSTEAAYDIKPGTDAEKEKLHFRKPANVEVKVNIPETTTGYRAKPNEKENQDPRKNDDDLKLKNVIHTPGTIKTTEKFKPIFTKRKIDYTNKQFQKPIKKFVLHKDTQGSTTNLSSATRQTPESTSAKSNPEYSERFVKYATGEGGFAKHSESAASNLEPLHSSGSEVDISEILKNPKAKIPRHWLIDFDDW